MWLSHSDIHKTLWVPFSQAGLHESQAATIVTSGNPTNQSKAVVVQKAIRKCQLAVHLHPRHYHQEFSSPTPSLRTQSPAHASAEDKSEALQKEFILREGKPKKGRVGFNWLLQSQKHFTNKQTDQSWAAQRHERWCQNKAPFGHVRHFWLIYLAHNAHKF